MSASFVSSFLMNIVALLIAYLGRGSATHDGFVDAMVLASVLANIVFYYAFGTLIEIRADHKNFIKPRRNVEWPLRVFSNVLLLCLPLSIEQWGLLVFWLTLLSFYIVLVVWDCAVFTNRTRTATDPKNPVLYDLLGLLCCLLMGLGIAMLLVSHNPGDYRYLPTLVHDNLATSDSGRSMFLIGIATLGFLLLAFISFSHVGLAAFKDAFKERY